VRGVLRRRAEDGAGDRRDTRGERAKSGATSFQNVVATIYSVLGIDLNTALPDFTGRPQYILDDNKPIKELLD
jgi:hypothetical protein